jgi:hypothetical protein
MAYGDFLPCQIRIAGVSKVQSCPGSIKDDFGTYRQPASHRWPMATFDYGEVNNGSET